MLTTLHGSWKRAAAIVLSEAGEGCCNETAVGRCYIRRRARYS